MATKTTRRKLSILNEMPPFPEGWYFVAKREDLLRRKLIERVWMGQEIVAWCDDEGRICVAGAFCPHLGSHMGPTVGGLVRDGCLVCPFHGFQFDTTGRCVATPNAPAPKAAKLTVYETTEILGMIFAWWGTNGRPPQWHLPDEPSAGRKWSRLRSTTLRFRGHPQETAENSVDVEHLAYTHGYHDVTPTGSVLIDGAYLRSAFGFRSIRRIAGLIDIVSDVSTVVHVHGLGYSFVEIHEKSIGMHARMWVLTTPVDGTRIALTLVTQVREIRKPGRFFAGLGFLPTRFRHGLMSRFILSEERRFVLQDVVIWERKQYRAPPRLSRADGPIGKFRLYCRQFYPEATSRIRPTSRAGQAAELPGRGAGARVVGLKE
ncbi:MAG: Rieske 2Fe-2S domain-containing protein [Gemmatimonadota bacterium]|nr:Rieske 2Fe-2S domain-containing protein [Gemmatimonadota bacterium]